MAPLKPLPFDDAFTSAEEYVESLLEFATTSTLFQTLCGGVHILDFFTRDQSLFAAVLPEEWQHWLLNCPTMTFLDLLMRDDLNLAREDKPPETLVLYVKEIRKHCLQRNWSRRDLRHSKLPRHVAVGMIPKKIHEVTSFAGYVNQLADDIATESGHDITHFVDFGSGQNYLGRALASPPYDRHIVAVESKELNISGAKHMDVLARVAEREVVMRNKKLYRQQLQRKRVTRPPDLAKDGEALGCPQNVTQHVADMRPSRDLAAIYTHEDGKGSIKYVEHSVDDGDLSDVVAQLCEEAPTGHAIVTADVRLMAISIHSCGNLSHHGIRSLLLNPSVQAVAIVGCCYNLLTERLGPPTYKLPLLRPNLAPINARVARDSETCDPHGYPMSRRVSEYRQHGIQLNITARMMAVQAPQNWTEKESDSFFTRHYFRALLQKLFLDYGVVSKVHSLDGAVPSDTSPTNPIIIGSLRKSCYQNFTAYVRGAIDKLSHDEARKTAAIESVTGITDLEIERYAQAYEPRKKELSIMWSLMAFSAGVVESLIVTDRWLFLKEHPDTVRDCWVDVVFDYKQSPRNLVVVGIR